MTPENVKEAASLLETKKALRELINLPKVESGMGELSLVEDVSNEGCGTRAYVYIPEIMARDFAELALNRVNAALENLGVKT